MFCVGLTGGIGSGKTTVANFFAKLGVTVIDADLIAREITALGTPGLAAITAHLGTAILTPDGELNRKKLRHIVFTNEPTKIWLEQTLHPLILQAIHERIDNVNAAYCIIVIPLLVETAESFDFLNRICIVETPDFYRKEWAAQRDQVLVSEIETIMSMQASREQRLAMADDVIVNNHDLAALETQVTKLHQQYLQIASV